MICPLIAAGIVSNSSGFGNPGRRTLEQMWQCKEDNCAWWNSIAGKCSFPALADTLHFFEETFQNSLDR